MRIMSPPAPVVNLALVVTSILSVPLSLLAGDWPTHRGPQLNGVSVETPLRRSGEAKVLWKVELGLGYSTPVIADGRVMVTGHDGKDTDVFFCLDPATGSEKWKVPYPQDLGDLYFQGGTTGTAAIDGDRVYHLSRDGDLFCLNVNGGEVIWRKNLVEDFEYDRPMWGFSGAPLVKGDKLFLNAGEAGIAFRKDNGELVWKSKNEEAGYAMPLPIRRGERNMLIFSNKRAYVCVDEGTGEAVWSQKWMTRYGVNAADPVLAGNRIFLSSGYGKGCILLDWEGGDAEPTSLWQGREMRTQMNAAILVGDYLYGVDGNESEDGTGLKCLDLKTGKTVWTDVTVGHGAVTVVGDQLLVLTEQGELQVAPASPSGYVPTFKQKVIEPRVWTVPVFSNGRVYCRNAGGSLVVLDMAGS